MPGNRLEHHTRPQPNAAGQDVAGAMQDRALSREFSKAPFLLTLLGNLEDCGGKLLKELTSNFCSTIILGQEKTGN